MNTVQTSRDSVISTEKPHQAALMASIVFIILLSLIGLYLYGARVSSNNRVPNLASEPVYNQPISNLVESQSIEIVQDNEFNTTEFIPSPESEQLDESFNEASGNNSAEPDVEFFDY